MTRVRWSTVDRLSFGPTLLVGALAGFIGITLMAVWAASLYSHEETIRAQATALIQLGQRLQVAAAQLRTLGIDHAAEGGRTALTSKIQQDLFLLAGIGQTGLPVVMAANPAVDRWYIDTDLQAMPVWVRLKVTAAECDQINLQANGITQSVTQVSFPALEGDVTARTDFSDVERTAPMLAGKMTGCLKTRGPAVSYYFFQVLTPPKT